MYGVQPVNVNTAYIRPLHSPTSSRARFCLRTLERRDSTFLMHLWGMAFVWPNRQSFKTLVLMVCMFFFSRFQWTLRNIIWLTSSPPLSTTFASQSPPPPPFRPPPLPPPPLRSPSPLLLCTRPVWTWPPRRRVSQWSRWPRSGEG